MLRPYVNRIGLRLILSATCLLYSLPVLELWPRTPALTIRFLLSSKPLAAVLSFTQACRGRSTVDSGTIVSGSSKSDSHPGRLSHEQNLASGIRRNHRGRHRHCDGRAAGRTGD